MDLIEQLQYYQRFCRLVVNDINKIRADTVQKISGTEILYCLDFSEVYAYVNNSYQSFSISANFSGSPEIPPILDMEDMHNLVIEQMLFQSFDQLLFLRPYWNNFFNYFGFLKAKVTKLKGYRLAKAGLLASEFYNSSQFKEITQYAEKVKQGGTLSEDEWDKVIKLQYEVIEKLTRDEHEFTLDRLINLSKINVQTVDKFLNFSIIKNEEVYDRWRKKLAQVRPDVDMSNYDDAEAVALLYSANEQFAQAGDKKNFV